MRVEDKQAENAIFHRVIALIINGVSGKRWKTEDRNVFFVGEAVALPSEALKYKNVSSLKNSRDSVCRTVFSFLLILKHTQIGSVA